MFRRLKAFSALAFSLSFFLLATLHAESSFVDHRGKTITVAPMIAVEQAADERGAPAFHDQPSCGNISK